MTAKKTTTTKTVEKEIKNSADEVKATTSTKATASKTTKASTRKKMTKEELVEKAMASAKAKKEAEKPVEEETTKATKATVKKPKTTKKPKAEEVKRRVLFLDSMSIKDFGDLQRVKTEDWEELKELFHEGAVILTVWNKKTIRNYDGCTPGVKVNDLYAYDLSDRVYDVVTPIYTKSTSEQVIAVSNFTEAAFIFYEFDVLDDAKYGEYRQSSDLVYEIYMPKKQQ